MAGLKKVALVAIAAIALVSCGQKDVPTTDQVARDSKFFEMVRPDGTKMTCVMYGADTQGTQESKSWFSFTCDWSGQYRTAK